MSGAGGEIRMALPRPGPAGKGLLAAMAVLGIGLTILVQLGSSTSFAALVASPQAILQKAQLWRLITSGLVTVPGSFQHLFFSLLLLYFLGPPLERRWGAARFLRFFAASVFAGNAASLVVTLAASGGHPEEGGGFYGPAAAMSALTIAFARELPDVELRLFFFLPVRGRALAFVTIGFAVLGLIYPLTAAEGAAAPFGGILAGYLLAGNPSPLRALILKARLALLRRQAGRIAGSDAGTARESEPARTRRGRTPGPPLRVVYGGLEEELKKRKPPKDKRYLN